MKEKILIFLTSNPLRLFAQHACLIKHCLEGWRSHVALLACTHPPSVNANLQTDWGGKSPFILVLGTMNGLSNIQMRMPWGWCRVYNTLLQQWIKLVPGSWPVCCCFSCVKLLICKAYFKHSVSCFCKQYSWCSESQVAKKSKLLFVVYTMCPLMLRGYVVKTLDLPHDLTVICWVNKFVIAIS